jgi:hypothetical protein
MCSEIFNIFVVSLQKKEIKSFLSNITNSRNLTLTLFRAPE